MRAMRTFGQKTVVMLLVILLAAAGWKALLLAMDVFPFNSDEAIVALMARHILQGDRPIFFYGQAYMGSLDAFLVSFGFVIFGQNVWVIRLVQTLLYLATIITTVLIARRMFGSNRIGLLAAAMMAIPTVNVTLYTTVSLGGYGEALLIGSLLLLISLEILHKLERSGTAQQPKAAYNKLQQERPESGGKHPTSYRSIYLLALLFGLLSGVGLWANGLSLVFAVPAAATWLVVVWQKRKSVPGAAAAWLMAAAGGGFLAGSAPWWFYALQSGWSTLLVELFGSAVAVEQGSWVMRTMAHLFNFTVLGIPAALGLRPPWEIRWLALPLLPLALAFWLGVLLFFIRQSIRENPYRRAYRMLAGVLVLMTAGFILTPFGADPSGRYFLPALIPMALAAAHLVHAKIGKMKWQAGVIGIVLVFNLWGTLECALRYPPGITTQFDLQTAVDHRYDAELIQFLLEQEERVGYSSYWVSYPLAFLSQEELIFAPRLPYHQDMRYTERDDRYQPYTETAASAERVAYISSKNEALEAHLRDEFSRLGVTWSEERIGDFRVFYGLSQVVHPAELGLGTTRP
jgi:4-amino-4-deoxy-L-arabinose transferase-like glycosyltransferase